MIVTFGLENKLQIKGTEIGVSSIVSCRIVSSIPEMIKEIQQKCICERSLWSNDHPLIFVGVLILQRYGYRLLYNLVEQAQYKIPVQYTKIAC